MLTNPPNENVAAIFQTSLLEGLGSLLGDLGTSWVPLGGLSGGSWRPLGRLLEILEASWASFGNLGGLLGVF